MMDGLCTINFNARINDPSIGRFLTADSIIPDAMNGQSLNRYSYVNNDPLAAIDPSGHDGGEGPNPAIEKIVVSASRLDCNACYGDLFVNPSQLELNGLGAGAGPGSALSAFNFALNSSVALQATLSSSSVPKRRNRSNCNNFCQQDAIFGTGFSTAIAPIDENGKAWRTLDVRPGRYLTGTAQAVFAPILCNETVLLTTALSARN